MRRALAASIFASAILLAANAASASPAMPRPLERIVEDADLVVVAKLRTRPAHSGDAFEVDVEATLKGKAQSGSLRAKAAYFFTGCIPAPEGTPPPPSIEGRASRMVLFLAAEKDGARQSGDPIVLDAESTVSAWFYDQRPASQAVETIKALVALDAYADVQQAGFEWELGLVDGNPLLVTCLLHRIGFATEEGDEGPLGKRLTGVARRQLAAARPFSSLVRLAASDDSVHRRIALRSAQACLGAKHPIEQPDLDALVAAARRASRDPDLGVRGDAVRCLAAARDPKLPDRLLAAMRKRPLDHGELRDVGEVGRALLFASYPDRETEFLAAAVAMLDDVATQEVGVSTLSTLTGQSLGNAEMWRAWWMKREGK